MLSAEDLRLIRQIHLRLGRRVDSPFAGEYRSAFRGQGMEFEDVRPYSPGDDVRRIDWNVTARNLQPYVKEFREEREMTLIIVADCSASMRFAEYGVSKLQTMARLGGALAFAAIRSGDRVGLLRFSNSIECYLPPRKGRGHVWQIIRSIFATDGDGKGTQLNAAIERLLQVVKRRATICILSDFWASNVRALRASSFRHHVHGFLLHDPLEEGIPYPALIDVYDAETGRQKLIDSRSFTPRFSLPERLRALQDYGVRMSSISTQEDPIRKLLQHFHRQRSS